MTGIETNCDKPDLTCRLTANSEVAGVTRTSTLRRRIMSGRLPRRIRRSCPARVFFALALGVVLIGVRADAAVGQEDGGVSDFYPEIVTEQTRADSSALARLEAPGQVFFTDGFEDESGFEGYLEVRGRDDGRTLRVQNADLVNSGAYSVQFTAPENSGNSSGSGGSLWFGPEGYDVVYFRRHIRFAPDYDQGNLNHTGGGLAGVAGSDPWAGMGQAGIKPMGDDRFTASFEAWKDWGRYPAPGYMFVYASWMDMRQDRDGHYWGNMLDPGTENRFVPERGRWYCLEQMIGVNDVGQANGEMATWIDGQLYLHCRGFRWRSDEEVRIKRASFGIYIHEARKENRVWYDDVALSTGYLGPAAGPPTGVTSESWGEIKAQRRK